MNTDRMNFEKAAIELHLFGASLERKVDSFRQIDEYTHEGLQACWLFWQKASAETQKLRDHIINREGQQEKWRNEALSKLPESLQAIKKAVEINDSDTLSSLSKDDDVIWVASGSWTGSAAVTLGHLRNIAAAYEPIVKYGGLVEYVDSKPSGMQIVTFGDTVSNQYGSFHSPLGRGFTAEELIQVENGTYINPPQQDEKGGAA